MQKSIFLFLLIFSCTCLNAQTGLDSLYAIWQDETQTDSIRTHAYIDYIGEGFLQNNPDSAFILAEELVDFSEERQSPKVKAQAYMIQGSSLYYNSKYAEALDYYQRCLSLEEELGGKKEMASSLNGIGNVYYKQGNFSQGLDYYQRGLIINEEIGNKPGIAESVGSLGLIYYMQGEYPQALDYQHRSLKLREELGDQRGIAESANYIGLNYYVQGYYAQALSYYRRSSIIFEDLGDKRGLSYSLYVIGLVYFVLENLPQALDYYQRGLKIQEETGYKHGIAESLNNIGQIYSIQGNYEQALDNHKRSLKFNEEIKNKYGISTSLLHIGSIHSEQGNYSLALTYYQRSLKINEEIGNKWGVTNSLNNIGQIYHNNGRYNDAIVICQRSLAISEEIGVLDLQKEACFCLYKANKNLGKGNKALRYHEQMAVLEDSMNVVETVKKLQQMEFEKKVFQDSLATDRKKLLVQVAHEKEVIALEANNARFKTQRNGFIIGSTLFAILGFISYNYFKIRKERNDKIEFAEALLYTQEEERKRIASDLHDSIGQSLLLLKKELTSGSAVSHQNQALISNTLEEVRTISHDLHPFQLEKFGLTTTLKDTLDKIGKTTDIFVTKDIANIDGLLSDKAEIHIYRVVQESLSNIIKHAKATAANLAIQNNDGDVQIIIKDNGVGYDHEYALATSKSLGLKTMYERISSIGGKLTVKPGDPSGTIIEMNIPKAL